MTFEQTLEGKSTGEVLRSQFLWITVLLLWFYEAKLEDFNAFLKIQISFSSILLKHCSFTFNTLVLTLRFLFIFQSMW